MSTRTLGHVTPAGAAPEAHHRRFVLMEALAGLAVPVVTPVTGQPTQEYA